jgi:3-isopropylmalate dehydratase small subunit
MPDFRARVHRGETFVVAGDRFAIGSSREMSPAGLKGVAEEAGLQMVVVCGHNMGDIFRRNAFNLGLHVVQSPDAVADAGDGDELTFDPVTRRIANVTKGKTYEPVPLSPKEEEIRRGGGIFEVGRREFRRAVETAPSIDWAHPESARGMTTTEQIIWAHRVDKDLKAGDLQPGATLRVYADLLPASDGTAPFSIHTFNQITGGNTIYPRQAAIANDHFVFTGSAIDDKQTNIGREFARLQEMQKPHYATPGDGIFHFYFPEQGLVSRGSSFRAPTAQPRLRPTARSASVSDRRRRVRVGDGLHYFTLATRAVSFQRAAPALGQRQGHRPRAAAAMGVNSRRECRSSSSTPTSSPIAYRNTIANMMAERKRSTASSRRTTRPMSGPAEGSHHPAVSADLPGRRRATRSTRTSTHRRAADDREALQPRERVPGGGGRPGADHVRQGDDRLLHERQLRRPAPGRAGPACGPGSGGEEGRSRVEDLPGIRWRGQADRTAGRAPRRRVDRGGVPIGGREIRQSWCDPASARDPTR